VGPVQLRTLTIGLRRISTILLESILRLVLTLTCIPRVVRLQEQTIMMESQKWPCM
jgi:hypothetical protein